MKLEGRTALITGGGRGIGRATAVRLAREGANVAINFKGNAAAAEEAKRLVEGAGGKATLLQGDVSVDGQADDVVKAALSFGGGRLDILVNNAGITRDNLLLRMSAEEWDAVLDLNLRGTFMVTKAAMRPMMKQRAGRIVNVASIAGVVGNAGQANYPAGKAGIMGSPRRSRARWRAGTSRRTPWLPDSCPPISPTRSLSSSRTISSSRFRSDGSARSRMSRMRSPSWPRTRPATSPVRSSSSTEEWSRHSPYDLPVSPRRLALVAAVAVVVFVADRLTKAWVTENIPVNTARPVIGDYVRIVHAQNTGAAFGLLPERTTLLSVLSVVAVLAIVYYYRRIASNSALLSATLGMQLGGAFGNLLDRVTQGYVVDFVDVGICDIRFWAFNVADSSIVVGIFLVTIALWYEERRASSTIA